MLNWTPKEQNSVKLESKYEGVFINNIDLKMFVKFWPFCLDLNVVTLKKPQPWYLLDTCLGLQCLIWYHVFVN